MGGGHRNARLRQWTKRLVYPALHRGVLLRNAPVERKYQYKCFLMSGCMRRQHNVQSGGKLFFSDNTCIIC
jgi:hypothetical protein